ncbi:MAG: 2,3-bisphosphoglycerate-independent phosphoglycerate mutase [Pseudomonadota bacterium]
MHRRPVVLAILDGWGLREDEVGNAPKLAHTPNIDRLFETRPHARLSASGEDVGLPPGQIGNSEVGHTNIGAGRVVLMDLPKINKAIEDGSLFTAAALVNFLQQMNASGGSVHLLGLISPGGVHSHQNHLVALATVLSRLEIPVEIHGFLDGRDVGPKTGRVAMTRFLADIAPLPHVRLATICGRFFAMDRDNRWDRVETAYRLIAEAKGNKCEGAIAAIDAAYADGITDEFIEPHVIAPDYTGVAPGDSLLSANFRADRMRELLRALLDPSFEAFPAERLDFASALGMVSYASDIDAWMPAIFPQEEIVNTLGEWMASNGKIQFRLAETEKYPHVTFFLNGGIEEPDPGEARYMAPSPKVRTYDLKPEMSCPEVADKLAAAIHSDFDLIVVNFANPDMVGHTGSLEAAIAACEVVDKGLGLALDALADAGGTMLVTADHGNCETMIDPETGDPHTAHTTNLVPIILVEEGESRGIAGLSDGRLADVAPTILDLMGLEQPAEMTGRSLLKRA